MADSNYSVLLPGLPQSASQAANEAFPGSTSTAIPSATPPIDTSSWDLNPITVTAQKMSLPVSASSLADWFKPPKLFLTIGVAAGVTFLLLNMKKKRSRR